MGKDLQFPLGYYEFREATIQTNRDVGKDPDDRLIKPFESTEVNGNLASERVPVGRLA